MNCRELEVHEDRQYTGGFVGQIGQINDYSEFHRKPVQLMEYDWLRSNFMNWGVLDAYQSFQSKVWESHKWWISTIKAKGDNWTGYGLQHILSADLMWRIALMWWKQDLHRFVLSTVVWLEYELTVQGYPKCFDN